MHAAVATPISAGARRIGVIGLGFDRERSFSPDELRFVEALAEEAGEALELARLFEAEQRALRRAARLQEVTARLARAVTTEDAARAIRAGLPAVSEPTRQRSRSRATTGSRSAWSPG